MLHSLVRITEWSAYSASPLYNRKERMQNLVDYHYVQLSADKNTILDIPTKQKVPRYPGPLIAFYYN